MMENLKNDLFTAIKEKITQKEESTDLKLMIEVVETLCYQKRLDEESIKVYLLFLSSHSECLYNTIYFLNELENLKSFHNQFREQLDRMILFVLRLLKQKSDLKDYIITINEFLRIHNIQNRLSQENMEILDYDIDKMKKYLSKPLLQIGHTIGENEVEIIYTQRIDFGKGFHLEEFMACRKLYHL